MRSAADAARRGLRLLLVGVGGHLHADDLVGIGHRAVCQDRACLIASMNSMPEVTWPKTVYWPSRNGAGAKQMKNWLSALSGLCARAMPTVPRRKCAWLNSAWSFWPEPPVPVPVGSPVCAMKPGDDAVEDDAVVEAPPHQRLDVRHGLGRQIGPQFDDDAALGHVEVKRVFGIGCAHGTSNCQEKDGCQRGERQGFQHNALIRLL